MEGAKVKQDKSVDWRLGTLGCKSFSFVEHWADDPGKMLGVWFGSDPQIENNWIVDRIDALSGRSLPLKGRAGVVQVFMASVIT